MQKGKNKGNLNAFSKHPYKKNKFFEEFWEKKRFTTLFFFKADLKKIKWFYKEDQRIKIVLKN